MDGEVFVKCGDGPWEHLGRVLPRYGPEYVRLAVEFVAGLKLRGWQFRLREVGLRYAGIEALFRYGGEEACAFTMTVDLRMIRRAPAQHLRDMVYRHVQGGRDRLEREEGERPDRDARDRMDVDRRADLSAQAPGPEQPAAVAGNPCRTALPSPCCKPDPAPVPAASIVGRILEATRASMPSSAPPTTTPTEPEAGEEPGETWRDRAPML